MVNHDRLTSTTLRRLHASSRTTPRSFAVVKYSTGTADAWTATLNIDFSPTRPLLVSLDEHRRTAADDHAAQLTVNYFLGTAELFETTVAAVVDGVGLETINVDQGIRTVVKLLNGL